MRLTGVIDYSMKNFLCIRGFASMWDLAQISKPDESVQRDLIEMHRGEMENYLNSGKFTFFPEVILGLNIGVDENDNGKIVEFKEAIRLKIKTKNIKINEIKYSVKSTEAKQENNSLAFDKLQTVFMEFEKSIFDNNKLIRIDGNHRLSAVDENSSYKNYNIPFCILLFNGKEEIDKFSRALFYNINTKQIPLKMEENLKVIIESKNVFDDDLLKTDPSFGLHFYLTRYVNEKINLIDYPFLNMFIKENKFSFFIDVFGLLIEKDEFKSIDNIENKVEEIIIKANTALMKNHLNPEDNIAVIGAFTYYIMTNEEKSKVFLKWIKDNSLLEVNDLNMKNLIMIYDKIFENRPKEIFISMKFGDETKDTYSTICRVIKNINSEFNQNLKPNRVDENDYGSSEKIFEQIINGIEVCDLLIADLSQGNKNVHHEIGYAQGFNKKVLMIYREHDDVDPKHEIGSNLSMHEQVRYNSFTDLEEKLSDKLKKFFKIV